MSILSVVMVITALFGVARFFLPPGMPHLTNSYAAFAHMWVGGLFGVFMVKRRYPIIGEGYGRAYPYLLLALALTVVEVVAFFTITK